MRTELEDVKRGATKILQKVNENLQENEDEMIDEYILVPFDDPGEMIATRDMKIYIYFFSLIITHSMFCFIRCTQGNKNGEYNFVQ